MGFPSAGSHHTFITPAYCFSDALWPAACLLSCFSHEWRVRLTTFISFSPPEHLCTAQPLSCSRNGLEIDPSSDASLQKLPALCDRSCIERRDRQSIFKSCTCDLCTFRAERLLKCHSVRMGLHWSETIFYRKTNVKKTTLIFSPLL